MIDKRLTSTARILRRGMFLILAVLCVSGTGPHEVAASDDGWWGSFCDSVKSWRRHVRRSHQEAHRRLYHPKYEPHFSGNYGYFETEWGVFPCDYGFVSAGSLMGHPSHVSPAPAPAPAYSAPQPGQFEQRVPMAPPAADPADSYFPPAPPTPERSAPPYPAETPAEPPASAELPILIPLTVSQPEDAEIRAVDDLVEDLFADTPVADPVFNDLFVAPAGFAELSPTQDGFRRPVPLESSDDPVWRPSAERTGIEPLAPQGVLEPSEQPGFRILLP